MAGSRHHRRAGAAVVLAGFLLGTAAGLTACDAGGETPSARPSAGRSIERPASGEPEATRSRETDRTTTPAETTTRPSTPAETTTRPPTSTAAPEPTRTTRTTTPVETTTRPPTSAAVVAPEPTRTTTPATTTPAPVASASAAAATADDGGLGPFAWLLLLVLVAALIVGGLMVYRSQQRSAWDTEARALESETRAVATIRLPPVLNTTTVGRRGLAWPPVRAGLIDVRSHWDALTERASGEGRRAWSARISELLQELIAAVEAENEAMAVGGNWMLVRPRVDRAEQALAAVLTVPARPEPPAAGQPGPSAYQT